MAISFLLFLGAKTVHKAAACKQGVLNARATSARPRKHTAGFDAAARQTAKLPHKESLGINSSTRSHQSRPSLPGIPALSKAGALPLALEALILLGD